MKREFVWALAAAVALSVTAAPSAAQKDDERGSADPSGFQGGGVDYNVTVDTSGELYEFIDATAGTEIFVGDDDLVTIPWPFDFNVYGDSFEGGVDDLEINSNGSIHFDIGGPRTLWVNCGDVPSTIDGQWVAPFSSDLVPNKSGGLWWHVTGADPNRVLTVSWLDFGELEGGGSLDFQVNFFEGTNIIVSQYVEHVPPEFISEGVVGINAGDGVLGTEVGCAAEGDLPRPNHDVQYTPKCFLSGKINDGGTIRAGDPLWVDFDVEHAKPGIAIVRATVVLSNLDTGARVAVKRFRNLRFEQFEPTAFGGKLSAGVPAGRYLLTISLGGMSGWATRSNQVVVID